MIRAIYEQLHSLGLTSNNSGFFYTASAVRLIVDDPPRLTHVTRQVYPEIARQYKTSAQAVERNIRTAINVAWTKNPTRITALAHHSIPVKPTASQFISILAHELLDCHSPAS